MNDHNFWAVGGGYNLTEGEAVDLSKVRQVTGTEFKADPPGGQGSEEMPCVFCNRRVRTTAKKTYVRGHCGTTAICVSESEGERLDAAGHEGANMGCYPIGSDCLRKVCRLVPGFREKFVVVLDE